MRWRTMHQPLCAAFIGAEFNFLKCYVTHSKMPIWDAHNFYVHVGVMRKIELLRI